MSFSNEKKKFLLDRLSAKKLICPDFTKIGPSMYGEGISLADLNALVDEGLAEARVVHRCARCPQCSTHQCVIDEHCVHCRSPNLQAIPLFHHIPCACVFEAPEGIDSISSCEKCHESLDANDNTVESVGQSYFCVNCGGRFPEPELSFICLGCGAVHAFHEVTFHRLWGFKSLVVDPDACSRSEGERSG